MVELPWVRRQLAQMVIEAEDRADREAAARREAGARQGTRSASVGMKHLASSEGDYMGSRTPPRRFCRDPKIKIGRDRLFSFMAR